MTTSDRSADLGAAAPLTAEEAAALMSARHGWLSFSASGDPLPLRLDSPVAPWQEGLLTEHRAWYGESAPTQVSGAFVLQYLLQVPADTAGAAAGIGMRCTALHDLTFSLGDHGVPRQVEIGPVEPRAGVLDERLAIAERDYRQLATRIAQDYRSTRPMSSQQRLGMVDDMWAQARRSVRAAAGLFDLAEPRRRSCCLIYALPGCVECAGCPRQGASG